MEKYKVLATRGKTKIIVKTNNLEDAKEYYNELAKRNDTCELVIIKDGKIKAHQISLKSIK